MSGATVVAFVLALGSTTLASLAYLREPLPYVRAPDAAAALPALSLRRPLQSLRLLLGDRSWLLGFAMEGGAFALYATALALAPLALVQSVAAGGIGLLAFFSARAVGAGLGRRRLAGVALAVLGLVALAISLANGGEGEGHNGSTLAVVVWLCATAALAGAVVIVGRRTLGVAVADGIAGGLCFSAGDISTKLATQGGVRIVFVVGLILGYTLGTSLLQLGYQAGAALTVAGLATLLTNVLPILAGTIVLEEPVPSGALGALRIVAFVAVTAGAVLLSKPAVPAAATAPAPAGS
jgi:hypothetical protein